MNKIRVPVRPVRSLRWRLDRRTIGLPSSSSPLRDADRSVASTARCRAPGRGLPVRSRPGPRPPRCGPLGRRAGRLRRRDHLDRPPPARPERPRRPARQLRGALGFRRFTFRLDVGRARRGGAAAGRTTFGHELVEPLVVEARLLERATPPAMREDQRGGAFGRRPRRRSTVRPAPRRLATPCEARCRPATRRRRTRSTGG